MDGTIPESELAAPPFRAFDPGFRWEATALLAYKEAGSAPFRSVTRQVLFHDPQMKAELRYFEVAPGGWSTLERHQHMHAVMILRGRGRCLVGDQVRAVGPYDLVTIRPMTWHQFRAGPLEPLGFLCMVDAERDKPQLPTEEELAALRANPMIRAFLAGGEAG
jgi:mannose-6-phosphate isomerase-like protein (cupin superfamily)